MANSVIKNRNPKYEDVTINIGANTRVGSATPTTDIKKATGISLVYTNDVYYESAVPYIDGNKVGARKETTGTARTYTVRIHYI